MEDYKYNGNDRILITPGNYEAVCTKFEQAFCFGKSPRLFLHFQIVEQCKFNGIVLWGAYNVDFKKGRIPSGSKYYRSWVIANKFVKPKRNDRMNPKIFLNKVFKVAVRTVKPFFPGTKELQPEEFHYSIIAEIIDLLVG